MGNETIWNALNDKLIIALCACIVFQSGRFWEHINKSAGNRWYEDMEKELKILDPKDINNWNDNSVLWNFYTRETLRSCDHFTLNIGNRIGMPDPYQFNNIFLNYRSLLILQVVMNAYRELLNNGLNFVYNLPDYEKDVLGINVVTGHSLDQFILMNLNTDREWNYQYWVIRNNLFLLNITNQFNFVSCWDKIPDMINQLKWIKGRFDLLNTDIEQSVLLEKKIKKHLLVVARYLMNKHWNAVKDDIRNEMPDNSTISLTEIIDCSRNIWDEFSENAPEILSTMVDDNVSQIDSNILD